MLWYSWLINAPLNLSNGWLVILSPLKGLKISIFVLLITLIEKKAKLFMLESSHEHTRTKILQLGDKNGNFFYYVWYV